MSIFSTDLLETNSMPTTTSATSTTQTLQVPIWNCNFDANNVLNQQCGGANSASGPLPSGPTWAVVANDVIAGITPSLAVTDVKSISINHDIFFYLILLKILF
jgi:hypothetical protein